MDRFQSLWLIQRGIYENIKFADSKAIVLVAINTAIIGGFNALNLFDKDGTYHVFVLAVLSFSVLSVAIILAICVIWPRGERSVDPAKGESMDPLKMRKFSQTNAHEFVTKLNKISQESLTEDLAIFILDRARTNNVKYRFLRFEIIMSVCGWFLGILAVFFNVVA